MSGAEGVPVDIDWVTQHVVPAQALRDAGWVDPEEAARLRAVVDAARAYDAAHGKFLRTLLKGNVEHFPEMADEPRYRILTTLAALDQTLPETAPNPCGPSCACHPEPLADVSALPLKALAAAAGDTALGRSVARVAEQVAAEDGVLSAFNSFVE